MAGSVQIKGEEVKTDDAQLIEASLEQAADCGGDIGPAVYDRFFERFPEGRGFFRVVDTTQPPHGCGQMLFEILSLLLDNAQHKPYVASYMAHITAEHASFGVNEHITYAEFLHAIQDVVAKTLGDQWSTAYQAAWSRQISGLLGRLTPAKTA